ncbi:uncharacterized protein N7511_003342 [Penicillium nucicola]|uniref:uncharacterized protein n=1 Tax=Penicillium nucicola TaxID=1850975 RepID=UPI002545006F|nr:uncharacterized protein N7511_003342 [Penicillium nucicola]KAJ5771291.1 hypothetical protein N7511_003342 [Penicillium nucicola]
MYQSWESEDFWIIYAVLHSFSFDVIYWEKTDPRFYGPTENPDRAWKKTLDLLAEKEKNEMEQLVERKLKEMDTRILAWNPDEYTVAFRQQLKRQREEADEEEVRADEAHNYQKKEMNDAEKKSREIEVWGLSGPHTLSDQLAAARLSS